MRFALVRDGLGALVASGVLAAPLAGQEAKPRLDYVPLDAYGVVCAQSAAEAERTPNGGLAQHVTYTGVVLSQDERVAGTLTVDLTITREPGGRRAKYAGRITVDPAALEGLAAWEGAFRGELRGGHARDDAASIGTELMHRRTARVPRSLAALRVAAPPRTRIVRRLLRGTGVLEGMRLVFHYPANEGVAPPREALPAGCLMDYEHWTGVLVDVRSAAKAQAAPGSAP